MKCLFCKSKNIFVRDTRWKKEIKRKRRRYECRECGKRFFTQEDYEDFYPYKHGLKRMKTQRKDVITNKCQRCRIMKPDDGFRTSFFNTDWICSTCQDIEEAHPEFSRAKDIEAKQVLKGNHNFKGIGLPNDYKEHERNYRKTLQEKVG